MNGVLYQEGAMGKMEQVSTELVKVLAQKGITVDEKGIIPLQKLNSIVQEYGAKFWSGKMIIYGNKFRQRGDR